MNDQAHNGLRIHWGRRGAIRAESETVFRVNGKRWKTQLWCIWINFVSSKLKKECAYWQIRRCSTHSIHLGPFSYDELGVKTSFLALLLNAGKPTKFLDSLHINLENFSSVSFPYCLEAQFCVKRGSASQFGKLRKFIRYTKSRAFPYKKSLREHRNCYALRILAAMVLIPFL